VPNTQKTLEIELFNCGRSSELFTPSPRATSLDSLGVLALNFIRAFQARRFGHWRVLMKLARAIPRVTFSRSRRRALLNAAFGWFALTAAIQPAAALEAGEPAPEFTMPSTMGGNVSLSDYRGKKWVLLEFYGADFAPT
jgi:hypothetical protein